MEHASLRNGWLIIIGLIVAVSVAICALVMQLKTEYRNANTLQITSIKTDAADFTEAPHVDINTQEQTVSTVAQNPSFQDDSVTSHTSNAPVSASTYIVITQSCDIHYGGEPCLNARSGPGTSFPSVAKLRNGMVLKIASTTIEEDGHTWYKVVFDEWLRYPERVSGGWYVAADFVQTIDDAQGTVIKTELTASSTKRIIVSRSEQKLYAYDGDTLFMEIPISTGLELTPTPRGTFAIYKKTPSRYMQGPLPGISDQYYDLPGVPWNLYFTQQGAVIHGAYWHNSFGHPYSHGCVNLSPENAQKLYNWAEIGTLVTVRD